MYDKIVNRLTLKNNRFVLITDENVFKIHGKKLQTILLEKKKNLIPLIVKEGEHSKSLDQYTDAIRFLFEKGIKKSDCIIGLGGGVVLDLTGFLASQYLRGVSFVFIPTTLMAVVDAAIGGKNGVNFENGKNLIGSFKNPDEIIFDSCFLGTLPENLYLEGFIEVIKYGLIFDKHLFHSLIERKICETNFIERSIEIKEEISSKDFFDVGLRRVLNFGHTVAHGIEKLSNLKMSHGQAVFIGLLLESYISLKKGFLEEFEFLQIKGYLLSLWVGFIKDFYVEATDLWECMKGDKKNAGDEVRICVLKRIGKCASFGGEFCTKVSFEEVKESLNWLNSEVMLLKSKV
jgi:3-dehydroquinate synthase